MQVYTMASGNTSGHLGKASEAIDYGQHNVFDAAVLELVHDA
jgi:hypothetical protein